MNILPPKPSDRDSAIAYIKKIKRKSGESDYDAVRNAILGFFSIAPMFFVFGTIALQKIRAFSIASGIFCLTFGIFILVLGHKTFSLLELFKPQNPILDNE